MSKTHRTFTLLLLALAAFVGSSVLMASAQSRGTEAIPKIEFKPGQKTALLTGTVTTPHGEGDMHNDGADRYSFSYRAGQRLFIDLRSEPAGAVFSLSRQNGEPLKMPAGVKWSGRLPGSGDYLINIFTTKGTASYTLKVSRR